MNIYRERLINSKKSYLKRIFPQIEDVKIRVVEDGQGHFQCKMRVHVPRSAPIIAIKKDYSFHGSLFLAQEAIAKQMKKLKTKRKHTHVPLRYQLTA